MVATVEPQEYSVNVHRIRGGATDKVLSRCVAHDETIDSRDKAARYYLARAIRNGALLKGDHYEVDVNVDAADDWTTVLTGSV